MLLHKAMYKCRLCGEVFQDFMGVGDDENGWRIWATIDQYDPSPDPNEKMVRAKPLRTTCAHYCKDDISVGVADFVGVRRETERTHSDNSHV